MNQFITKDSGDRASFSGGMVRDTESGKTRWDLIPNELFDEYVLTKENEKFISAFRGWQAGDVGCVNVIEELIALDCGKETSPNLSFFSRVAELMQRGAEKYGEWNWTKSRGDEVRQRYFRSADRHFKQYLLGDLSEDHAAAIFFNINGTLYATGE